MTKRDWAKREAAAKAQRDAAKRALLLGDESPRGGREDADYAPMAAFTITATSGEANGWFDLDLAHGIGAAMERAAEWRQDARLARYAIRVFAGERGEHTLREIAVLSEVE